MACLDQGTGQRKPRRSARALRAATPRAGLLLALITAALPAAAQDATWNNPAVNNSFLNGANWSTGTVPTGTAFFGASNITGLALGFDFVTIGSFTYNAGAGDYTFLTSSDRFDFTGAGIVINGGSATVGNIGVMTFLNSSTASSATFRNSGGGDLRFGDTSTAANATIDNLSGNLRFSGTATAGSATITNNTIGTNIIGTVTFGGSSTAGSATIVNNAILTFTSSSSAGDATITNNGSLLFFGEGSGGAARLINGAGGIIDLSGLVGGGATAGSIEGAGNIFLGSNNLTAGGNNLSTTFSGVLQDGGNDGGTGGVLTKAGTGTLTLTGSNTYTGGTGVNGGVLAVSADNNLGGAGGGLRFGGGTLQFLSGSTSNRSVTLNAGGGAFDTNGNDATLGGTISGTGGLTKAGAGTLTLAGSNTYTGGTTVNGGVLAVSADNNLGGAGGGLGFGGGTLQFLSGFTSNRSVTLNAGGGAFDTNGNNATLGGTISGTGGLIKAGTGSLTLAGANTYTGATTVNGGTLAAGALNALGNLSATTVAGGATLDLNGFDQTLGSLAGAGTVTNGGGSAATLTTNGDNSSTTFSGVIQEGTTPVTLVKAGTGTLTLAGANTYTGPTTVNGGTLAAGAVNAFSAASATTINTGGTLDLGGFAQTVNAISLAGGTIGNGTLTGAIGSTGGTIDGIGGSAGVTTTAGTTIVLGSNGYTGATTVSGGTLVAGAANAFSAASATTINTGGTLDLGGFAQTVNAISLAGGTIGNGTLTGAIGSTGGTIDGIGGSAGVTTTAGTTIILGSNGYTGATTVNGSTVVAGAANAFSAASATTINTGGTLDLGGFAQTVNAISLAGGTIGNGTLTGAIGSTGGTIDGIGGSAGVTTTAGTTIVLGSNGYTGATTVDGGTLIVNGSIVDSALTVNAGGALGGNGAVGDTIINGGTLTPGNSIGTLMVQGNLVLTSAAAYIVEVSPTQADRTKVTGSATLAGTVQVVLQPGAYVPRSHIILSATGGLGGTTFSGVTAVLPNFDVTLSYTATDAILNVAAALGGGTTLNQNQQNVASAISSFFNNSGTLPAGFMTLFGLTGPTLGNVLTQLSGEAATGAQQGAFKLMDQFQALMLDPFVDGRSGVGGAGGPAPGFAPERPEMPEDIALAYSKVMKTPVSKPAPIASFEQRWTAWGAGFGGSNKISGDSAVVGSHGLTARTVGYAAGLDYHVTRDTVAGFALAGGGTNWSLAQGIGGGRSDAFQAGVYAATRSGPAYLAASLAFANHWMSTDRFAAFGDHLTADFKAQSYGARTEAGYRFGTPVVGVTPYAAVQAQSFRTPGYSEVDVSGDGFGLDYNSRTGTETRSELGARFYHVAAFNRDAVLTLRGRLAWGHDWVSNPALAAAFQALPGTSFIVNGATPAKDSALVSTGAELRLASGVMLSGKFDGGFARGSQTYAGAGTIRYAW